MKQAEKQKAVRIRCRGAALAALDELVPIQGELKKLSDESAAKLEQSILKYGITFPFFVWQNKNKLNILDGTQRDRVLLKMRAAGYAIPKLPIDYIEAANIKEAKEKILLVSSEYGRMDKESFERFIKDADITIEDIKPVMSLSHVDFAKLEDEAKKTMDQSALITETWAILIECSDEKEQGKLLAQLAKQGLVCRALVS